MSIRCLADYFPKTHLHDTRLRNVILTVILAVGMTRLRSGSAAVVRTSLALARLLLAEYIDTLLALSDPLGFEIIEYSFSRNRAVTLATTRRSPRAMTLYEVIRKDSHVGLHVVDILRVIGEQFATVL